MDKKTVVIIGGGLAGLSAGYYALANGFSVRVFEHAATPGGVCTAWRRKGYLFDGCIHWLIGARSDSVLNRVYHELGLLPAIPTKPLEHYLRFVDEQGGREPFSITANAQALRQGLLERFPSDAALIEEVLSASQELAKLQMPLKPSELMTAGDFAGMLWKMRKVIFKLGRLGVPAHEYARRATDPWLARILENIFHPHMSMLFNLMTLGWVMNGDTCQVLGGSLEFSRALERKFLSFGGEIRYNATVERIIVESGKATGVRLADGTEHRADYVVSAADLHATLYDMLEGKYLSKSHAAMFANWEPFTPICLISYGVRGALKPSAGPSMIFFKDPIRSGPVEVKGMHARDFSFDPTLAPEGCSIVQVMLDADFEHWTGLRQDNPEEYKKQKQALADQVLNRLEPYYPGIKAMVEVTDVATPATFVRYTRNWRGAYEGWIMTLETLKNPVKKTVPGLANLYLCGQWVEPGGGVPTALVSGRMAAMLLCHNEGREFKSL